jgi:hypothetical protein
MNCGRPSNQFDQDDMQYIVFLLACEQKGGEPCRLRRRRKEANHVAQNSIFDTRHDPFPEKAGSYETYFALSSLAT